MEVHYQGNRKLALYGTKEAVEDAKKMLDDIPELDMEMKGFGFAREGHLRQQIQEALEHSSKAEKIGETGENVSAFLRVSLSQF